MATPVYLKPNVVSEPLVNQWYAWPYLIPPACGAMYLANAHVKIMESFVAAPLVHAKALENPDMLGGPFIGHDASRAPAVRELLDRTTRENAEPLALAAAIRSLDALLASEATGESLEPLYPRVPEALRGYVELVYDARNNASFRFVEPLLYRSRFYREGAQSVALAEMDCDGRPFVFSTPRLRDDGRLYLDVPLRHEGLDALYRAKTVAADADEIAEALGVGAEDASRFASLFTETPPAPREPRPEAGLRVRYFGHACVLLETARTSVLVDPVVSYAIEGGVPRFTFADLPERIDYVLVTHTHQDHVMFETLLQLRHKIGTLVVPKGGGGDRTDPSLKLILKAVGFANVVELDELETIELEDGRILGVPFLGEHADLAVRTKLAYHVRLAGTSVMLAADTNNVEPRLYDLVREEAGGVDVLFLGMECDGAPMSWLYGPLFTTTISRRQDQSRRFDGSNFERARALVDCLAPSRVYVYAMGQEPWCTFLTSIQYTPASRPIVESDRLVAECATRGIAAERLFGCKELVLATPGRVVGA